eukprot:3391-Chlamydomonas_euryale.AAC.1
MAAAPRARHLSGLPGPKVLRELLVFQPPTRPASMARCAAAAQISGHYISVVRPGTLREFRESVPEMEQSVRRHR